MESETPAACPRCGAAIPPGAEGLCPACLLSGAIDAPTAAPTAGSIAGDAETIAAAPQAGAPLADVLAEHATPAQLGEYAVQSELGRGGMGVVYEAIQPSTGRRLALKVLNRRLDSPEARQRFLREGRLAARVTHPNSLYVFGSEEIEGSPAIVMEVAAGGTLHDALRARGPFPVAEAVDAILDVVAGLEAAEARGVLHRDIKPSNCFVSPDGRVKIGDFGLSVSTVDREGSLVTANGKVMGTPAFASPEQLRGDAVDLRSDVYSVGATLYMLLTGRPPFEGDNPVQVVANVIANAAAPASSLREELPKGLDRVLAKCMAKDPGSRYASYAALRKTLAPFSSALPEPVTPVRRAASGWIDFLLALFPAYVVLMFAVGPQELLVRWLFEPSLNAAKYYLMIVGAALAYFSIAEGLFGGGVGKAILGQRVVRLDGKRPGPLRALGRIAIPIACIELLRIPLSVWLLPNGVWGARDHVLFITLYSVCPFIVIPLGQTAKPGNGHAFAWDLLTGTRVVSRHRAGARSRLDLQDTAAPSSDTARSIGPYRVDEAVVDGVWLTANDPILKRRVWLVRRAGDGLGDGPGEARRNAARPARARWLQAVDAEGEVWDAYEAGEGAPLRLWLADHPAPAWSIARHWLHDIAHELWQAKHDGSSPASASLDHVWVRDDGQAVLLDEPWPSAEPAERFSIAGLDWQLRFLHELACVADADSLPAHATPVLDNLRDGKFEKLTYLVGTLRGLLDPPADLGRGVRAASLLIIPLYVWMSTFVGMYHAADLAVGPAEWARRLASAGLVMLCMVAVMDLCATPWRVVVGQRVFGLTLVSADGRRASHAKVLARWAVTWAPLAVAMAAAALLLNGEAWASAGWILGGVGLAVAASLVVSAMRYPGRAWHDRLVGTRVVRR